MDQVLSPWIATQDQRDGMTTKQMQEAKDGRIYNKQRFTHYE
jgi:hypothetical protein